MSWVKNICFLSFRELTKMRSALIWDINTTRWVTSQKSAGLVRFAAEDWNQAKL